MRYRGAIFDMDGLLLDTERIYQQIWQEIAEERGVMLDSCFVNAVSGTNGQHMCRVIERYYHVTDGTAIRDECMGRIRERLSVHVPVKQGVQEILDFFHEKNMRTALAAGRQSALCLKTAKMESGRVMQQDVWRLWFRTLSRHLPISCPIAQKYVRAFCMHEKK